MEEQIQRHPEVTPITNFRQYFGTERPSYRFPERRIDNWYGPHQWIEPIGKIYGGQLVIRMKPYMAEVLVYCISGICTQCIQGGPFRTSQLRNFLIRQ